MLNFLIRILSLPNVIINKDISLQVKWHLCYNLQGTHNRNIDAADTCLEAIKLAKQDKYDTIILSADGSQSSVKDIVTKYELESFVAYNHTV